MEQGNLAHLIGQHNDPVGEFRRVQTQASVLRSLKSRSLIPGREEEGHQKKDAVTTDFSWRDMPVDRGPAEE